MSSRIRPARPSPAAPAPGWSTTSGSTGCGCRRGARTRSATRAAISCAPWASTSDGFGRALADLVRYALEASDPVPDHVHLGALRDPEPERLRDLVDLR